MQANIGLLYFKATAAVVRCVYNWVYGMHVTAADDPMLWDQVRIEDGHLQLYWRDLIGKAMHWDMDPESSVA